MHSTPPSARKVVGRRGRRPGRRSGDPSDPEAFPEVKRFSCLYYEAPGSMSPSDTSLPIEPKATTSPSVNVVSVDPPIDGKRAPRKSKIEALAALRRSASPSSPTSTPSSAPPPQKISPLTRVPIINKPLDLSTVNTVRPDPEPPRDGPRPFGLEDCPTYFPTPDEFKDPLAYISSIREQAEQYGICKIVPPKDWKMPFVTDTTTFRFKTRMQSLNSIEATSRAKLNFLDQLYRFHGQGGNPFVPPKIAHKPLDVWVLRKEVHKRGGYQHVTLNRLWGDIGRAMGYEGIVGVSTQLKNAYTRIIHPFDAFVAQVRGLPVPGSPDTPRVPKYSTRTRSNQNTPGSSSSSGRPSRTPDTTAGTPNIDKVNTILDGFSVRSSLRQSPVSQVSAESTMEKDGDNASDTSDTTVSHLLPSLGPSDRPSSKVKSESLDSEVIIDLAKGDFCEICKRADDDPQMLICDGCERGGINSVPSYECLTVVPPHADAPQYRQHYKGMDHSLSSFQARANAFREAWFQGRRQASNSSQPDSDGDVQMPHANTKLNFSEDDVEREFWRLVESPTESVEIEYGADVHSTTHGSAMPTMETHPLNEYSNDPWNINNIPILPGSLLRYIKSDISGMTVPWTYVGMVFSTFCWHNEDHYTYSINYMHWGDTKTWYGIPGEDAAKFEAAIKKEAPDLFEAQPDLLFQLVTLMHPERVRNAGVRVYAANQRAGEFVVTFPQAYHCGFNHGFNFNEAVNFALPEWLPFGRACARRYQEHQKVPVFSHDELLFTIYWYSQTVKTAVWLYDNFKEMTDRELGRRAKVRASMPSLGEFFDPYDRPEEQYQCSICKVFCYLAQITCVCTSSVACLEHADSLCQCSDPVVRKTVLRTRFSDGGLRAILEDIEERRSMPEAWEICKSRKCLDRSGYVVHFPQTGAPKTWRRPKGYVEPPPPDPSLTDVEYTLDEANELLAEADSLGFDSAEIVQLATAVKQATALRAQVVTALQLPNNPQARNLAKFEVLLADSQALTLRFPEVRSLESSVTYLQLLRELDQVDDSSITLEYVEDLLSRARENSMDSNHEYFVELERKRALGIEWRTQATELLKNKPQIMETVAQGCTRDLEKQAKAMISTSREKRATPDESFALIERASDYVIPAMEDLRLLAQRAAKYSGIYKSILAGQYVGITGHPLENLFQDLITWRAEIRQDLSMMNIPTFTAVDEQLSKHEAWLQTHPWWRRGEHSPQSTELFDQAFVVFQDVIRETRAFTEDLPTPDCTCICTKPVTVVANDTPTAVQCDSCNAKFHEACITGSCPFCDHHHWDGKLPKARNYTLQDLVHISTAAPPLSKHYSAHSKMLTAIISSCTRFSRRIDTFMRDLRPAADTVPLGVLPRIRHIMRKLYTIQFRWPINLPKGTYGAELAVLHRTLAVKPLGPRRRLLPLPLHLHPWCHCVNQS
ncbi:hypothetical protein BS47DRAFT_1394971 [Hydnum rufescens UP504]|uniref:Uncharacterized protein n=1 Tax=Hydnum rufescens UP504 TaxID=1448309 RepID=A0A9P6ATA3_9AGAM|nr:hypothetical protein BS47DRAFT_1394971 [Hydnum rufescens UP504]